MTAASAALNSPHRNPGSLSVPPRTARAFGSAERARRVRDEIEAEYPRLAQPALRLFDSDRGRIFRFWSELSPAARETLLRQVAQLDLDLLDQNLELLRHPQSLESRTAGTLAPPDIFDPSSDPERERALALGEEVLKRGWLAVVEGAGGTGSRFFKASGDKPKGLFPVSPTGTRTFFEVRLDRLIGLRRRYGRAIPYLVMVSDATEEQTREYFQANGYFGLEDEIRLVRQRSLPYLEEVGQGEYDLVLESPGRVAVGGYGHADFTKHVLLQPEVQRFLAAFGTRYVQWLQIDNPLAVIGHRYLLGAHRRAEPLLNPEAVAMSFIALKKEVATEAAGLLVRRGGGLAVWEYSDMDALSKHLLEDASGALCVAVERDGVLGVVPPEQVRPDDTLACLHRIPEAQREGLRYRWSAINPNLVVVSLDSVVAHPQDNPPLVARKSAQHIDADGKRGDAGRKFLKFEAFLFDGLNDGVVVAEEREECFAPTKNAEGEVDSPISARRLMVRQAARRLREIDWEVAEDGETIVELDGLLELEPVDRAARLGRMGRLEPGAILSVRGLDLAIGDGLTVTPGGRLMIDLPDQDPRSPLSVPPQVELPPGTVITDLVEIP